MRRRVHCSVWAAPAVRHRLLDGSSSTVCRLPCIACRALLSYLTRYLGLDVADGCNKDAARLGRQKGPLAVAKSIGAQPSVPSSASCMMAHKDPKIVHRDHFPVEIWRSFYIAMLCAPAGLVKIRPAPTAAAKPITTVVSAVTHCYSSNTRVVSRPSK